MKDKSYEERYQAYKKEGEKLIKETVKERDLIYEKYKNKPVLGGLDGGYGNQEYKALLKKFDKRVKELREKYGINKLKL